MPSGLPACAAVERVTELQRLQLPGHPAGTAHVQVSPTSPCSAARLRSGRRTRSRWRSPGGSGGPSWAVRALRTPRPARGFPAALRGLPTGAAAVRERAEGPRPLLGAGPPAGPRPRRVRQGPVGPGGALAGASVCPLGKALPLSPVHCGWKELLRLGWVRGVWSRFLHHQRGRAGFVTSCVSPRAWDCSSGGCPGIPSVSGYFLSKRTKGLYRQEELKRGSEEI